MGVKPAATNLCNSSRRLKPGENVHSGRRVRSREKRNAGTVHRLHHFQFLFHEAFPDGEIVSVELVDNLLGESLPRHVFPECGYAFGVGVVGEIRLVDQIAAALPTQRGALPGVNLRQQGEKRRRPRRI
jgi:hypothetical protein